MILTTVLSLIVSDATRFRFVKHMVESISEQSVLPDYLEMIMYVHPNMKEIVKEWIKTELEPEPFKYCSKWKHPSVKFIGNGQFRAPFRLMKDHRYKTRGENEWILFAQDDGIWHPQRVAFFKREIAKIHDRPEITMVSCGSTTTYRKDEIRAITFAKQVDYAIDEGDLVIEQWDSPDHEIEEGTRKNNLEISDVCIRSWMFHEYLNNTKFADNLYADIDFTEYCSTKVGYSSLKTHSIHWLFFTRYANPNGYKYLDGQQISAASHMARNAFDLVPLMERIAQMDEIPALNLTAKNMLISLTAPFSQAERAMLVTACTNALKLRNWCSLDYLPFIK
jgi:hypothetical protein